MTASIPKMAKIPLWLDCDPGHDDAFAILFAAYHPALDLLGVSTVYGNASLDRTTKNALSVLQAIGKSEILVFPGAAKPFCREAAAALDIHGESGLDGTNLLPNPSRKPLSKCNGVREMHSALLACPVNSAWLVATGSLTNVALLFAMYPEIAAHIRGLSIMGGAIGNGFRTVPLGPSFTDANGNMRARIGNHTPYAEFNIWCDPESAQSIFKNPILKAKIVLIPLDVTHQAFATSEIQNLVLHGNFNRQSKPSVVRQMYHDLLLFFAKTYAQVFGLNEGPPLHDPVVVAALLHEHPDPEVRVRFDDQGGERWEVTVVIDGAETGRTKIEPATIGVMVPRSLDLQKFWHVLNECLDRADECRENEQ